MNEDELKSRYINIVKQFSTNKKTGEIIVWDKLVEYNSNIDGCGILKQKIENTLTLLNETIKKSKEDFDLLMKRDIETDIWYIV